MSLSDGLKQAIGWFGMPFLPIVTSYLTYELLGMVVTNPLSLVLFSNIIIYTMCLFIAYVFKKWENSFVE